MAVLPNSHMEVLLPAAHKFWRQRFWWKRKGVFYLKDYLSI